jgi:putative ABC transport system permease protein
MINIESAVKISFRALRVNKMRSALTMLGIIIGVMAVIAMLSVGSGARKAIGDSISAMGSNLLIIVPGATTAGGAHMGSGSAPTLTLLDTIAIKKECPAVLDVAPMHNGAAQVVFGHQNWTTQITGSTPSFLTVRDWNLQAGRNFTDQEAKTAAKVALLGRTVVENLFGGMDPVGQMIRIKDMPFLVIGVLESKGQSMMGQDQDDAVIVPFHTAQKKLFGTPFPGLVRFTMVKAKSNDLLDEAEKQITMLLHQRHHIGPKQDNDFTVRNLTQIMETFQTAVKIMTILLGAIASISLLVGGIGIMNIMLVSVTERTREIGIRMAVGAKMLDIRLQFIIEAMALSITGGTVGIIIGIVISELIAKFSSLPVLISVWSILLGFGFSALVGIFFGFYPAYKASLLNPIDALRYE